jgi:hypothetical protein
VEVYVLERQGAEPGADLRADTQPAGLQLPDRRVDVQRVPPDDGVQPEAERPELVLSEMILKADSRSEVVALLT